MKLFNFGIPEIILILVVMIIFLGPDQIVDLASKLGRAIRKITHSEIWTSIWQTSREIRSIPKTLAEETGLDESLKELKDTTNDMKRDLDEAQNDIKSAQVIHPEDEDGATAALKDAGYITTQQDEKAGAEQPETKVQPKPQEVPTLMKKKDK